MSFKEVLIVPEGKCYVVQADNRDDAGQKSNGGGKTSLIDILPVALLGKSIAGRDLKKCVNWYCGEKYLIVFVELVNVEHNLRVEIKRTFYSNTKSSELSILVNGEVPATLPSKAGVENGVDVRAGNEYILKEILDITEEDLFNYYIICGGQYEPFLRASVDKKTEVISRFSNMSAVDKIIDKLEVGVKAGTATENDLKAKIANCQGYITAQLENISEEAEKAFEEKKAQEAEQLYGRQGEIQFKIEEQAKAIQDMTDKVAELESQCVEVDTGMFIEHEANIANLRGELKNLEVERRNLNIKAKKIETYIAGEVKCPKCNHWFNPKPDGERLTKVDLNHVTFDIKKLDEREQEIATELNTPDERVEAEMEKERQNVIFVEQAQRIGREIESVKKQQVRYQKELDDLEKRIKQIMAKSFEIESMALLDKIEAKEKEEAELKVTLNELFQEMAKKQIWVDRFQEFKFFLANKPLDQIVGLINQYLVMNGSDLNLAIEGFKKLKNGTIKPDLRPVIYRNWTNPQDFAQFSAGEQCRLNVSVDLTFQQLINSSSRYGGLDLYLNDELVNGLDSLGISLAAEAFNQLGKTIILVSHSGADMTYENTLTVVKEGGISTVQE